MPRFLRWEAISECSDQELVKLIQTCFGIESFRNYREKSASSDHFYGNHYEEDL